MEIRHSESLAVTKRTTVLGRVDRAPASDRYAGASRFSDQAFLFGLGPSGESYSGCQRSPDSRRPDQHSLWFDERSTRDIALAIPRVTSQGSAHA